MVFDQTVRVVSTFASAARPRAAKDRISAETQRCSHDIFDIQLMVLFLGTVCEVLGDILVDIPRRAKRVDVIHANSVDQTNRAQAFSLPPRAGSFTRSKHRTFVFIEMILVISSTQDAGGTFGQRHRKPLS